MTADTKRPRIEAPFIIGRRGLLTSSLAFAAGGLLSGCSGGRRGREPGPDAIAGRKG